MLESKPRVSLLSLHTALLGSQRPGSLPVAKQQSWSSLDESSNSQWESVGTWLNLDDAGIHSVPGSQRSEPGLSAGPVTQLQPHRKGTGGGRKCPIPPLSPQSPCCAFSVTVLCPSCPSPSRNCSQTLYPLCEVGHPCSPTQLCPWTLPGPICHCVFEDGLVRLLADSATGLQASWGRTYDHLMLSLSHCPSSAARQLRVWSAALISSLCRGRECQGPT